MSLGWKQFMTRFCKTDCRLPETEEKWRRERERVRRNGGEREREEKWRRGNVLASFDFIVHPSFPDRVSERARGQFCRILS